MLMAPAITIFDELRIHLISERADGVDGLKELASLSEYHIYTTLNAKNQFRAPTEWGLCLRPAGVDTDEDDPGLVCLACDSERTRGCWLTAMRLAKTAQLACSYIAQLNLKLSKVSFALRTLRKYISYETLTMAHHANFESMLRKRGNNNTIISGPRPIDEDNFDLPKRFRRQYLQQNEVDLVNSGGASKYDVIPKKAKKDSKDKDAKEGKAVAQKIDDSKDPLDEENLDVPKRYQRQLLQQMEVKLVKIPKRYQRQLLQQMEVNVQNRNKVSFMYFPATLPVNRKQAVPMMTLGTDWI
ncbi:Ribosomal protein S36, mitochondrial [Popillia japonica]|uniref:Ribosomal protein S36, mitochondrial n=1 Tax=Popillia japonica TaxID=7064 RepID=A0AAW1JJG0_POPJA